MTTQAATLHVQERTVLGKKVSVLRRQGVTPIHLYGPGIASQTFQVDTKLLRKTLTIIGYNRPVEVVPDGSSETHLAFVREIQFHPLTTEVVHVDFLRVDSNKTTTVEVPVEFTGESSAVRNQGGSLIQGMYTVLVEARPMEIPEIIVLDIAVLDSFDKALHVSDLVVPTGVVILTDSEQMVAHVTPPVSAMGPGEESEAPTAAAEPERIDVGGGDDTADASGGSDEKGED
jgi:large subunit ribosomal protein L25